MSEREYPPVVPEFAVSDPQASIAWFEKLGFSLKGTATMPDGTIVHAEMVKDAALVMLGPATGRALGAPGLRLYMKLNDGIDAYYQAVRASGIQIAEEIADQFWGDRTFVVQHPDGYQIMFAQAVRHVTMEEVQTHLERFAAVRS
jgi:uncharacterized glyoxalase superfamily protein PhnB